MECFLSQLEKYIPYNEQEERDRLQMLHYLKHSENPFLREDEIAHFTASAWIVNRERTKVLMCYHNLYQSWSWTGGHADGETDLLGVAIREGMEETGIRQLTPVMADIFSIETLVVEGHEKRGRYVPCHLHMNATYLLEAEESLELQNKPDENSAVMWISIDELETKVSEPWMMQRIYRKLNQKMDDFR